MDKKLLLEKLQAKRNGTWMKIKFSSDLPLTAEAKKNGITGKKIVEMSCRKGIQYKNISSIKDKVEQGYQLSAELPWGHWTDEGLIEHKGSLYARLYPNPNKNAMKMEYLVNGKSLTREELQQGGNIQQSYFNKSDKDLNCMTIKIDNILEVK